MSKSKFNAFINDYIVVSIQTQLHGVVVTLSVTQSAEHFYPRYVLKYTKIWCVQVHLLSSSCSGHTYSCSLIQQRNGVDQRPICTAQLYGQKLFFLFIRDVVIIFISGLSSLTVFPWSKDFCV